MISVPEAALLRKLCTALLLPAAGVCLLLHRPKAAAVLMTVLSVLILTSRAPGVTAQVVLDGEVIREQFLRPDSTRRNFDSAADLLVSAPLFAVNAHIANHVITAILAA